MTAKTDFQRLMDNMSVEDIKGQIDNMPVVPETGAKQENDSSTGAGDVEFRPLTEEEKKEFVNSLNAEGKQILAELAGKRND